MTVYILAICFIISTSSCQYMKDYLQLKPSTYDGWVGHAWENYNHTTDHKSCHLFSQGIVTCDEQEGTLTFYVDREGTIKSWKLMPRGEMPAAAPEPDEGDVTWGK